MSTTIVDQFGRPAVAYSYSGAQRYKGSEDDRYRLNRPRLDDDIAKLLSREKYRMLLCDARYIAETFPLIAGMIRQKKEYVSAAGWLPEFTGADEAWGERVTQKIHDALNFLDVRGLFDFTDAYETACGLCDIDGGVFELFTRTETGFPQSQFLEAHRIGSRASSSGIVGPDDAYTVMTDGTQARGVYAGLRIINGIIYSPAGREVAYRILGATPADDRDVSARDMQHICEPIWFSEGRPFPSIACAILDWYDVKESREFQRIKQKANSAVIATESNANGEAPPDTPGPEGNITARAKPTDGGPTYQVLAGGLIRYLKSGEGKLDVHTANDPSEGWRAFDQAIVGGAFYGAGWHIGMMDAAVLGRSATYAVQDWINTTIVRRHARLKSFALRSALRVISTLIDRGDIPGNAEWYKWDIPAPPEFSVDSGRAQQADRDNTTFGLDSEPAVIRRTFGRNYKSVLRERARFARDRNAIATEFGLKPEELALPFKPGQTPAATETTTARGPEDAAANN